MRKMHLFGYLKTGPTAYFSGGWRHPEATLNFLDPVWYEQCAQTMEAAKLDGVLFADLFGVADTYQNSFETYIRAGGQNNYLDPMTVVPIMARVTTRLGIAPTVSTTFFGAFQLARALQSLDILSKGRIAWNVITSTNNLEARNAGMDEMPSPDERYALADEIVEAVMALWNTWEDDAFVLDKVSGRFADPAKVHYANYVGQRVKTRGPLPSPRSPQGHPVIMQAGSSPRGREFGARWGEILFIGGADKVTLKKNYDDMKQRVADAGRDPDKVRIVASITPILGETETIARERADFIASLEDPEYNIATSSLHVGADLSVNKTSEAIERARGGQGARGFYDPEMGGRKGATLAERAVKGEEAIVGTPAMVADILQDLFEARGCDGFVIMPTTMQLSHEQFCRGVVPELQRRGVFRTEYSGATLRENVLAH